MENKKKKKKKKKGFRWSSIYKKPARDHGDKPLLLPLLPPRHRRLPATSLTVTNNSLWQKPGKPVVHRPPTPMYPSSSKKEALLQVCGRSGSPSSHNYAVIDVEAGNRRKITLLPPSISSKPCNPPTTPPPLGIEARRPRLIPFFP